MKGDGIGRALYAATEARSLDVDRYPRDGVLSLRHASQKLTLANAKAPGNAHFFHTLSSGKRAHCELGYVIRVERKQFNVATY